ncbi:tyrosine-type recombinase/integrase [Pseudomonas sp. F1_0610]|uniref:tyrosine-type recombinase/integrase n=1 Tax=Pseudomonas sp. F1_0610 TaxID=3114284 RepID=UPI0039C0C3F0
MNDKAELYGSRQRATDSKTAHKRYSGQVRRQMELWIPEHLPVLLEGQHADNTVFLVQVRLFRAFLREQYNDLQRLKLAYEYLARTVARGNDEGYWALDIPSTIVSVPRSRSSRNHQFFKNGIEAAKLHRSWLGIIERSPRVPSPYQSRLADVLISAAYYGGIGNPRALTSLANLLQTNSKPLQRIGEIIWLDLVWSGGRDPLNYKIQQDSSVGWQTLYRFYPDNRTLGLILSLQNHKNKREQQAAHNKPLEQNDVWSLIKTRLLDGKHTTSINSLRAFCSGAQSVTEMLQDVDIPQALLECASGRVASTSLLPEQQRDWLLQVQPEQHTTAFDFQTIASSLFNSRRAREVKKEQAPHRVSDAIIDPLLVATRRALRSKDNGLKRSLEQAIDELNDLLAECTSLNAQILIHWLINRIGPLKLSSVYRYHIEVSSLWFYHTNEQLLGGQELDELDESELEHIYGQILASKDDAQSRNYLQGRLQDMHQFASEHYGLPPLNSFFSTTSVAEKQTQVRAGYIPEAFYQSMLKSMDALTGLEQDTVEGLKVLLILAYRTGMRRGELLKIRLSDIEESAEAWIYVVNNRYGNNKTDSARRKIPTYLLLQEGEFKQFQNYIGRRRSQNEHITNTLAFSDPHAVTTPHSGSMVSNLVKYLLTLYGLSDLTFHHLRHSALTNLMVVMHGSDSLTSQLTGYSLEHAELIRAELYCANPNSQRDIYSAIAGLAGHLTPETTFLHYIHETSLLLWERLKQYNPELNISEARYFSGLSTEFINKHISQSEQSLKLSELRPEIIARLTSATDVINAATELEHTVAEKSIEASKRHKATVTDCYSALKDIEDGDSIAVTAIRYALAERQITNWFEAAKWLQSLKTSRGNRRLFPKNLKATVLGIPLLPARVQDKATTNEVDKTINQLRQLYIDDRDEMLWCMQYWIYNTSQSRAGIRFTDPKDLKRFIKTLHSVIPYSRWYLRLLVTPQSTLADLEEWRIRRINNPVEQPVKTGKTIQAYLTLRHADEKNILASHKKSMNQYSSTLLKYVFHMLAIMIGIGPEEDRELAINDAAVSVDTSASEETQPSVETTTQADSYSDSSSRPDDTAQSSSPSELDLNNRNQQEQKQTRSIDEVLNEYLGGEFF